TGVIKNTRTETILNKTYQEMAEHYGTAVIPARVYTPKDYPQNHIIFKISGITLKYRATPQYFEYNKSA
ncbi:MAG: hypothetical protein PHV32_12620, partial [Eubacteriales bacterium]|nr:hypothetical protein [Eubacteriales bacterium]